MKKSNANQITRSYAKAIFAISEENQSFKYWQNALGVLSNLVEKSLQLRKLIASPDVAKHEIVHLLSGMVSEKSDKQLNNLLTLLARSGALLLLPQIFAMYLSFIARKQQLHKVEVTSAFPLNKALRDLIHGFLHNHVQGKIEMVEAVDAKLIGGVVIRLGSRVIDASLKTLLKDMAFKLRI
ncbi:MAG: hypothetical protein COB50_05020 [Thiotrichales bacterium]|nr:MAG: hypothetical protein COB50_05020 [Thiotrichales bacterium]